MLHHCSRYREDCGSYPCCIHSEEGMHRFILQDWDLPHGDDDIFNLGIFHYSYTLCLLHLRVKPASTGVRLSIRI